jgi:hypothetical protein
LKANKETTRMKALAVLLWTATAAPFALGQSAQIQDDCFISFSFTAAGQVTNPLFDTGHNFSGCVDWQVVYYSTGFSALSLAVESAPDSNGAPGTFVTFAGTVITGVNPNTATTSAQARLYGYFPWNRVHLASVTGSGRVSGILYGCRQPGCSNLPPPAAAGGCVGTVMTPCVVEGPAATGMPLSGNPVLTGISDGTNARDILAASAVGDASPATGIPAAAPSVFNGATWDREFTCRNATVIDDSAMGNTQILAAVAAQNIRICKMTLTAAATVGIQLTQGTGVNCATGNNPLGGLYQAVLTVAEDYVADQAGLIAGASQAVCLNLSAGTRTTGTIFWSQY